MAAAARDIDITGLAQLEALAGEVGGPHLPHFDVGVRSVTFGDAAAMAVMLEHLSESYHRRVGNLHRRRDLHVLVNRVAVVTLPRLRSDVRDGDAAALLRGRGAAIVDRARQIGGLSVDALTFGDQIHNLANHISDPRRWVRERQGRIDAFASVINDLRGTHITLPDLVPVKHP